jgi:hypothetical protein
LQVYAETSREARSSGLSIPGLKRRLEQKETGPPKMTKKLILAAAVLLAALNPALAEKGGSSLGSSKFPPAPKCAKCKANPKGSVAAAKLAITYQLKDPDSVKWRRAMVDDLGRVCIEVNSKNSFGGYTGFEPVVYESGRVYWGDMAYSTCLGLKWRGSVTVNAQ